MEIGDWRLPTAALNAKKTLRLIQCAPFTPRRGVMANLKWQGRENPRTVEKHRERGYIVDSRSPPKLRCILRVFFFFLDNSLLLF